MKSQQLKTKTTEVLIYVITNANIKLNFTGREKYTSNQNKIMSLAT